MKFVIKISVVASLLGLLVGSNLFTQSTLTTDEVLEKIKEADNEIKDIKFSYTQELEFSLTKEEYLIEGEVAFKKPDKIYICQFPPFDQVIVGDKKEVKIYNVKKKQVAKYAWPKIEKKFPFIPTLFPAHLEIEKLKKIYDISISETDDFFLLALKRKKCRILLSIDKQKYIPIKTEIKTKEYKSLLSVENLEINKNIPDDFFQIDIPKDVEEINIP